MDGWSPRADLIMDQAGNLYGTTFYGGYYSCGFSAKGTCGTVFRLIPSPGDILSVAKSGDGTGTVTSSPAGIDCGSTCSAAFAPGAPVTLTATPASGSTFTGWSGACSGTGTCVVTMNADTRVTAGFGASSYTLSVTVVGSPGGAITSSPSGIDCGATCGASFSAGTQVMLTATPANGWGLAGWGGACSGVGPNCTVTLNASTSVSASFATLFGPVAAPMVRDPTDTTALPAPIIGPNPY
jgi:hypothetical protein